MESSWRIVVPVRLSDAKSRLSSQPAPRRRALVLAMAQDVVDAARACPLVGEVVVVADDEGRRELESSVTGAAFVPDPGMGLNAALLAGGKGSAGPLAALLADVPCATADDLTVALEQVGAGPAIVSDSEGIGTTLLAARTSAKWHPRFGPRSRAAHVAAGAVEIHDGSRGSLARLRRDVDSEVGLWDAERLGLGPRTRDALA